MAGEARGSRARRSRPRGDVIAPRSLVRVALVGGALALVGAFGAGWWLGHRSIPARSAAPTQAESSAVRPALAAPAAEVALAATPTARPAEHIATSTLTSVRPSVSSASTAAELRADAPVGATAAAAAPLPGGGASAVAGAAPEHAPVAVDVRTRPPARGYGVQLGAFETEAEARDFVATHAGALAKLPVFVVPTTLDGRGTWHRVRAGDVKTRAAADALRAALTPELAARAIVVSHK